MKKRLLGILLSFALMLTMMPVLGLSQAAYASNGYEQYKNTTTVIKFDNKDWYLIDYDSSTVTLLSKECVGASQYNSSGSYVVYDSSTVKTAVDNWYRDNITADAKTAVVDNKMFLLTIDQANAMVYYTRKCSTFPGTEANFWWLCSPGVDNSNGPCVDSENGDVYDTGGYLGSTLGVRPALKLDLSKVVFVDSSTKTFSVITPYPLWVGGTQVTSANAGDILGNQTASYVAGSNTLTLNGATITTGHKDDNYNCESGIYYNGSELLNIVLADDSENTVEIAGGTCSSQIGIYVDASTLTRLNFSGKGQLTVSGSNYGIHAPIITIDGCDVTASGGSGIHSYRGNIEIKGGSVYASATNYAIYAASDTVAFDVIINAGSKVTASGGNKAIFGKVKNAIAGIGWTDTAGTTGETNFAVGEHTRTELENFKKVQFPVMFTVTFTDGQGKTLKTEEVASGTAATAPADPTRDGYTFKGWDKDFSNVTEDITVTALWEKKSDPAPTPAPATASVTVNAKTVSASTLAAAYAKAGVNPDSVATVVLGKKVKKIKKGSFQNLRNANTLVVKSKKLTKARVKGSLKGSSITKVKVNVGKKKTNKKYVKRYKKIFTKKNCGKKVSVSR